MKMLRLSTLLQLGGSAGVFAGGAVPRFFTQGAVQDGGIMSLTEAARRFASEAASISNAPAGKEHLLAPEAVQAIQAAVGSSRRHAASAAQLASLTMLAGCYRDIALTQEALHRLMVLKQPMLSSQQPSGEAPQGTQLDPSHTATHFPVLDVTRLADDDPSVPQGPQEYDAQFMDRITCWQQTRPNHVETSVPLQTGISLFPPQEATLPTYVDFQAATRLLERHKSRKRLSILRRIKRYQDKYQLRTWDHRRGE